MKRVTHVEFYIFKKYNPQLKIVIATISDPNVFTLNDFSEGKQFPQSVLGSVHLYEHYPMSMKGQVYGWELNRYYLKEE